MYLYTVFKIKLNSYIGSMLSCCYLKLLVGSLVYFSIRDDSYKYDQCDQLKQWYFMCIKLDVGKISVFFLLYFINARIYTYMIPNFHSVHLHIMNMYLAFPFLYICLNYSFYKLLYVHASSLHKRLRCMQMLFVCFFFVVKFQTDYFLLFVYLI